ncbi:dephospho-CoA kinase [Prochlorococcus marinus str. MIT 9312]|uniref:Dephospho-CoA kinase n=1 Tax=Prochlorococcus marinus (strain MIT 9312) TaxID=74546 RepID=COAE_PROM9|nr:dephospho-CoA kinase [Prochlorococcus marinus]Q31DD4.1 RecName: Full=Dephospho-CoA kinase; AltName: Full=Dephosphocoenzyme A kinase [Prochlorococcus marinus str. MIT 9312]ABB49111.1 dephospho-CoA kinase [Prochlorococcus marinus str. MIT 9312]KGF99652.1 Dephospho-CoA kinase [Prochlorococcus marinus str. MIT 9311]
MDVLQKLKNNQRRIGLTGGIASGKSTITNYIRKHKNIPILDADNLSRELIKPNTYGYKKILDYFGNQIIDTKNNSEKAINRKLLRNIIFKHSESKEWIDNLLHPLVKEKMIEECIQYKNNQTIVLVIPLLFEAKFEDICTEIWLVKCPRELQKKRLITRDKISEKEAYETINLQLSFEEKSKFSDIILDNSDDQNKWINTIREIL